MKIVLQLLLLVAIATLAYMCVQSIMTPQIFEKANKERQAVIVDRLIAIRNAQIGYRNYAGTGTYAGSFEDLQKFLNEVKIPFITKEGELTDDQLKAGMNEKDAVKKGLIRRDTTFILAKDTLLSRNFDVASIGKVPGFENESFKLDTATLISTAGYTVPVFEASVQYDVYLGDLDRQELINLKDMRTKMKKFTGLKVGSVTEINNNAGNWESL
jgi:hypothetical protein